MVERGTHKPQTMVRFHSSTQKFVFHLNFYIFWLVYNTVTCYNIILPIFKKINKDFFKKWTTQMAYILGFFAADGYITLNKRGANFWCIEITDKEILCKIKDCIESEHKIGEKIGMGNNKNLYRLQIGSFEMCDDLRKLGFDKNKTKSLAVPNIPEKYFSDFVRGYFDGDGNVWVGLNHKNRLIKSYTISCVFTSCSFVFLEALNDRLERIKGMKGSIRKGQGDYFRLTYSVISSLKLYNFMYNVDNLKSGGLFLKRKKDVFEKFIKLRL